MQWKWTRLLLEFLTVTMSYISMQFFTSFDIIPLLQLHTNPITLPTCQNIPIFPCQQQRIAMIVADMGTIVREFALQLHTTNLAVKHWWIDKYRKTRMTLQDVWEASQQIFARKPREGGGKGTIFDALADTTPIVCYEADQRYIQEAYFGITILVLASTLGGIVGNLWSEFSCVPQLGVLQALLIIVLMPLQMWIGVKETTDMIGKRRSELCVKLFFMGFSMGQLCDYNLTTTGPRVLCPLVLAVLIEKFAQRSATKKGPPQSNVKGNRLELFLAVASVVSVTIALLLVLTRAFTSYNFFLAFLAISFYISLLSAHFQLFFYGLYTLRERWAMETMKEEGDQQHFWNLNNVNAWIANVDLGYSLAVLLGDVLMTLIQ